MKWSLKQWISLSFIVPFILLIVIGFTSYHSVLRLTAAARMVQHTVEVQRSLEALLGILRDAETGQRGFLITGEERYLEPYLRAQIISKDHFENLVRLTATIPEQQELLAEMRPLIAEKLAELEQSIDLRRTEGFNAALRVVQIDVGKKSMDRIRQIVSRMKDVEDRLFLERESAQRASLRFTNGVIVFSILFSLFFIGTAIIVISRSLTAQEKIRNERNLAETARVMTVERLQLATRSADIGIWDWDVVNDILAWDDAMCKLYGISPENFSGAYEAWRNGVHPEDSPGADAAIQAALGGDKDFDTEFRVVWPDGEVRNLKANATVLRDESGRPLRMIGVNWDITTLKQAEAEQGKAKAAAEANNQAKSEFLANMSHEIRTPLNGILGMIELLQDTEMTAKQREFLTMAGQSAESLISVINDILDFSKIGAGKLAIERYPFRMRQMVEETVSTLGLRAGEKNLELTCRIAPEVPDRLVGDPARLRQILINLVGNAVKFTEAGEIYVEVTMDESSDPSGPEDEVGLHLSVRDTGIGIPPEKQALVFDAFSQVDASTARTYGGTGLGLPISSQLVALMGGRIWVESEAGRGSTFHFTARLGRDKKAPEEKDLKPASLRSLRVLVVDDHATNRRILEEILQSWGVQSVTAKDGPAAVRALEEASASMAPFDLVLTDYQMPGMHGLELARRIRENPEWEGVKIILLSSAGKMLSEDKERWRVFDDSLTKPVRQSNLQESILRTMGISGGEVAKETETALGRSLRPLRILLVEDSEINQVVAVGLLEKAGHSVAVAGNGIQALEELASHDFDLVLMDVQMPGMDGLEATRRIRRPDSRVRNPHVPVIAMTALAMKGDRERCLDAGMNGYVSKPVRPQELFEALNEFGPAGNAEGSARTAGPPSGEVFDLEDALQTVDGNRDLLDRIIGMFLESAPRLVEAVGEALAGNDSVAVRDTAHKLKGTVGNFGARAAFDAAFRLEETGASGDLGGAEEAFREVEREVERLVEALRDFRKRGPG